MSVQMMVRAQDPLSSVMAAEAALAFAGTHCDRILASLKAGEKSAKELAEDTGLTVVQIDRRLPELQRAGKAQLAWRDGAVVLSKGYRVWEAV